jgi:hypothetical protein
MASQSMSRRAKRAMTALVAVLVASGAATTALLALAPEDPPSALAPPRFVDETDGSGIEQRYDGEFTHVVGGGVAALDCDGDGLPDLYIAGGTEPAGLFRNASAIGGSLRFERLPDPATDLERVTGAYALDVDDDGQVDLAVLRVGENVLLRGRGDCTFERANERLGFEGGDAWTTAFSATWEGVAPLPTLAIGNYLLLGADEEPTYECDDNELVRPAPAGTTYAEPMPLAPGWCTLSLLFSDWDRSGRRDLRVSNDRHYYRDGEEQLWRVAASEEPRLWSHEEGWATVRINGMGIASHDLTGDGHPEVYLTSQGDNKLQTPMDPAAGPAFGDMALRAGVTAHRPYAGDVTMPSTAWHPEFADVNNDGFVDLFVSKGNVEAQTDHAARDPSNLLLGQPDDTFIESAPEAGIVRFDRARGAALVDLNLDGLLDLVVVNRREPAALWRNVGSGEADAPGQMGNWLALRLEQPAPNRNAVGAWVEVYIGDRVLRREVTVGGGHASGQLGWIHFGLGDAERAEVSVVWPDGEASSRLPVEANRFVVVERGTDAAYDWRPEAR